MSQVQPMPVVQQPQTTTTTVVLANMGNLNQGAKRDWQSGICGCFDDFSSCIIVSALCCVGWIECYGCHLAMRMNESCCLCGCVPGYLVALRTKLRTENNIEGSICNDCIMAHCCRPCVMCQMTRELHRTG